jgi:hypothetical protein
VTGDIHASEAAARHHKSPTSRRRRRTIRSQASVHSAATSWCWTNTACSPGIPSNTTLQRNRGRESLRSVAAHELPWSGPVAHPKGFWLEVACPRETVGSQSSQLGRYQFQSRGASLLPAGGRRGFKVASIRTATARPMPICLTSSRRSVRLDWGAMAASAARFWRLGPLERDHTGTTLGAYAAAQATPSTVEEWRFRHGSDPLRFSAQKRDDSGFVVTAGTANDRRGRKTPS